jgi:hypothetical protein
MSKKTSSKEEKKGEKKKGELKYYIKEDRGELIGGQVEFVEKKIVHSQGDFYAKFRHKKGKDVTIYEVHAPSSGKDYTLTHIVGGQKNKYQYNKADLLKFLKSHDDLKFIVK